MRKMLKAPAELVPLVMRLFAAALTAALSVCLLGGCSTIALLGAQSSNADEEDDMTKIDLTASTSAASNTHLVVIGDSHISRLAYYCTSLDAGKDGPYTTTDNSGDAWVAQGGQDIEWFTSELSTINSLVGPGSIVIVNISANDLFDISSKLNDETHLKAYLNFMEENAARWYASGAVAVYLLNIIDNSSSAEYARLDTYNEQLALCADELSAYGVGILDGWSQFIEAGELKVSPRDGNHFTRSSYAILYKYLESLKEQY